MLCRHKISEKIHRKQVTLFPKGRESSGNWRTGWPGRETYLSGTLLPWLTTGLLPDKRIISWKYPKSKMRSGLPWWRSGWESACQCRGRGFEPWSGKIPHAAERLGLWATTTEPARLEPVLRYKRGRDNEKPAHCDEEWPPPKKSGPHSPQLEKALTQKRKPNTAININK